MKWGMMVEILTDFFYLKRIVPGRLGNYHSPFLIPHYFNNFHFTDWAEQQLQAFYNCALSPPRPRGEEHQYGKDLQAADEHAQGEH